MASSAVCSMLTPWAPGMGDAAEIEPSAERLADAASSSVSCKLGVGECTESFATP